MTKQERPKKLIYKIQFHNQGQTYELYAHKVSQSPMYAFIEISDIIFGEKSNLVVDPLEERLKAEFKQVNRTHIPLNSVVRIDEVNKEGVNKIIAQPATGHSEGNVTPFPILPLHPGSD